MKYKPTEEILIAYLYGELDNEESVWVESYLESNPEEKARLEGFSETRMIFNELDDEELPEQLAFISPSKNEEWLYWRKYVAIAATILLILTFGWVSGFKIDYSDEGLYMGYGQIKKGLTVQDVANMIDDNNISISDYMERNLQANKDSLEIKLELYQASNTNQSIIKKIFDQEKDALITEMVGLNDKLSGNYREIMRQLIVSFSNNIETQRINDLRGIQAAFTDLEDATIGKQFEIENALSNLEEKVNSVIASNSNNN